MNESNNDDYNIDDDHDGAVIMMMMTIVIIILYSLHAFIFLGLNYNTIQKLLIIYI